MLKLNPSEHYVAKNSLSQVPCFLAAPIVAGLLWGCTSAPQVQAPSAPDAVTVAVPPDTALKVVNRVTWGLNASTAKHVEKVGLNAYLNEQLSPVGSLPTLIAQQIAAMTISQQSTVDLVQLMEQKRKDSDAVKDDAEKKAAQQAYQVELNRIAREAAARSLLRAVYSPNQLEENLVWFWMNHFNVHQGKANNRVLIGDYEERAIRPHVLGKFRDLVAATLHHPAMIRYLDNEQNAVNRINENYAREIIELHTLGVNGGYSQTDVQELARVLTGVGINLGTTAPNVKSELKSQYVRSGLWEFNPMRHDYGDKVFLGETVKGRGIAELDQVIDRICNHPATARFVSTKLARYFVSDDPPAGLIDRMAASFSHSGGDIKATLRMLFAAPEFMQSLGSKFKDPAHYVVSAVRLAYDDKVLLNTGPMLNWLNRMAEPLYGRQTPDGYSLNESAWASPGQMSTRFEIAKAIGSGSAGLFKTDGPQPTEKAAFPQLANALYFHSLEKQLSVATKHALEQAGSPQEWNAFLLSSPELMHR